ncbi:MAG: FMN-binding protein [Clostridiales bacterium]|nr:FMN-binding protein [Clostridiales bacterium]
MAEGNKKTMNPALKQSIIAVAVLVVICLVCGLLLALCNDLLYVSDEVKLARAMQKIYKDYGNGDKEFNEANKNFAPVNIPNYGTITEVKKAEDGAYVISAKGGGGYKGTITLYVVVKQETVGGKADAIVKAWTIKEHDGETFLGNITSKQQSSWYVGKSITGYDTDSFALSNNKVAGTTLSSTAINNAVKSACVYCIEVLKLVSTPESEAKDAIIALLGEDGNGYTFNSVTDDEVYAQFAVDEQDLSFYFEGTKDGADSLEAYVYGEGDDRQIVVVKAGLTHAERLEADAVVKTSENATQDVIDKVQSLSYFEALVRKSHADFTYVGMAEIDSSFTATNGTVNKVYTSTDGSVVIEATGTGGFSGGTVSINVVIADGVIKGWWIAYYDASQTYMPTKIIPAWNTVKNWYVGSSINADIVLGDNMITDATMSSTAINNAVNTACKYAREVLSDKEGA